MYIGPPEIGVRKIHGTQLSIYGCSYLLGSLTILTMVQLLSSGVEITIGWYGISGITRYNLISFRTKGVVAQDSQVVYSTKKFGY